MNGMGRGNEGTTRKTYGVEYMLRDSRGMKIVDGGGVGAKRDRRRAIVSSSSGTAGGRTT